MMLSCQAVVGGALPMSATNAVQTSFFEVASIRAEPLVLPPTFESIAIPTAELVPKITFAPGTTMSELATASLNGGTSRAPKYLDANPHRRRVRSEERR